MQNPYTGEDYTLEEQEDASQQLSQDLQSMIQDPHQAGIEYLCKLWGDTWVNIVDKFSTEDKSLTEGSWWATGLNNYLADLHEPD